VQTEEAENLVIERNLRGRLLHVFRDGSFQNPVASSYFVFFCKYWFGFFGPTRMEAPYLQPVNDLFHHLTDSWFGPVVFFNAIFAQMVLGMAMAQPPDDAIGVFWAWRASAAILCFLSPITITMVPLIINQQKALAAVPRERLRGCADPKCAALSAVVRAPV
jgi:hypothetical protein